MSIKFFTWPQTRWHTRKSQAVPRRIRVSARPLNPAQVELLECRSLLSITSVFSAGTLNVSGGDTELIRLGADVSGETTLNGTPIRARDGSPVAASSITSLNVLGGSSNDVIDLSGITLAAFTALSHVNVDGGAGDDLIIGSEFADNFTIQSGNDTVSGSLGADTVNNGHLVPFENLFVTSNPASMTSISAASTGTAMSTSLYKGLDLRQVTGNGGSNAVNTLDASHLAHDPKETDSKDSLEDHLPIHFHWQREPMPSHPSSGTPNSLPASFDPRINLASLSSRDLNATAISRPESKPDQPSGNLIATKLDRKGADGLIDINEPRTADSTKRTVGDISTVELPDSTDGIPLIAARVAMPSGRVQRPSTLRSAVVPSIFTMTGDGGFIELDADATKPNSTVANHLKRQSHVSRHDQVDAEIGRFVASEQVDGLANDGLATAPRNRLVSAASPDATDSETTSSAKPLSWGLMLSVGIAMALWRPPARRRMIQRMLQTLGSCCRRAVR